MCHKSENLQGCCNYESKTQLHANVHAQGKSGGGSCSSEG